MGSLMVSLDADDFILLCSITVKHAPAAIGFLFMMNQCDIIVNMVIDLEKQTPDMIAGMLTGDVKYIQANALNIMINMKP